MWLPTVILLMLVFMVTARADDRGDWVYHADDNSLKNHGYPRGLDKRAVMASFTRNWLKILKTSIWGGITRKNGYDFKTFFKVGTRDDMFEDFYSLNPTSIEHYVEDQLLIGQVGNHQIIVADLRPQNKPSFSILTRDNARRPEIVNTNRIERHIMYVEDPSEAAKLIKMMRE